LPFPYLRYYDDDNGRYYTALTWSWNAGEALLDLTLRNIGRNFEFITSDEQGGTRNPFLDDVVQNQATKPGNVMYGYNAEAEEIFDAWTSGTVIGAGKTLEAYYTVCLNGNGKYVDFQGNTPPSGYTIERVIYVKSDGLADHTSTSGWTSPSGLQPTASSSAGPTIAECWAAINEYLTKFNGSQNNFTFLISYDEIPPADYLLLDDYPGAAAAYSLRKLDKDYTGDAVRVRRASDNTEEDIGFDANGDLDTSALATFCSGTNGFVKTWYDQSGNGNDATQTTTANQAKIYDSSTGVLTRNSLPTLSFNNTSFYPIAVNNPSPWTMASVHYFGGGTQYIYGNNLQPAMYYAGNSPRIYTNTFYQGNAKATGAQYLRVDRYSSATGIANINYNGSQDAGFTGVGAYSAASLASIGSSDNTGLVGSWDNDMQELIFWSTYQSDGNLDGIETDINDYYSIY
jgi:hypothetical protein